MRVRSTVRDESPVVVFHQSSFDGECRHCHRPIALYDEVGWVDRTPPVIGGFYDMCAAASFGQHEPR